MDDVTAFRITYDGPALERSEMDVRELAPALLAVGDLLEAATRTLHGDRVKPQVKVLGSFKTGSFGIDFSLAANLLVYIKDFLRSEEIGAISNALGILAALGLIPTKGFGLLGVLQRLRGRRIKKVEVRDSSAIIYVDEEWFEVEIEVLALLRDTRVRESVDRVLEPLSTDGIDVLAVGGNDAPHLTIRAEEREWFQAPHAEDDLLLDEVRKMAFSIVSLAFKDDNKWRLHDGNATIHAAISDADFRRRVDENLINFAKSDVLVCNVRVRQWQTDAGTKTDYEIVQVLEHRTMRQINLPGV